MAINKLIHIHFLSLYIIAVIVFIIVIYRKLKYKKGPKELTKEKFKSTLTPKMVDVSNQEDNVMFNIWPFVNELKRIKILPKKFDENELVYKVFRDSKDKFEHILLNTDQENQFIAIVVDLTKKKAKGYYQLQSQAEYSLG